MVSVCCLMSFIFVMIIRFVAETLTVRTSMITSMIDIAFALALVLILPLRDELGALIFLLYLFNILILIDNTVPWPWPLLVYKFIRTHARTRAQCLAFMIFFATQMQFLFPLLVFIILKFLQPCYLFSSIIVPMISATALFPAEYTRFLTLILFTNMLLVSIVLTNATNFVTIFAFLFALVSIIASMSCILIMIYHFLTAIITSYVHLTFLIASMRL